MATNHSSVAARRRGTQARSVSRPARRVRAKVSRVGKGIQALGGMAKNVAQEKLDELRHNGQNTMQDLQLTIQTFVREQPVKSLVIAAGAGFMLATLWRLCR